MNLTVPNVKEILDQCQRDLENAIGKPVSVHYSVKIHNINTDTIIKAVCEHFQITWSKIILPRRERESLVPRQIFIWLACIYTQKTLAELGQMVGGKDHTTIIHAREMVRRMIQTKDMLYMEPLNAIEQKLFE